MNKWNQLDIKLNQELKEFEENELKKSGREIYDDFLKIHFYEKIVEFLKFGKTEYVDKLLKKEKPIEFLWANWVSCDIAFSADWYDLRSFLNEVFRSYEEV